MAQTPIFVWENPRKSIWDRCRKNIGIMHYIFLDGFAHWTWHLLYRFTSNSFTVYTDILRIKIPKTTSVLNSTSQKTLCWIINSEFEVTAPLVFVNRFSSRIHFYDLFGSVKMRPTEQIQCIRVMLFSFTVTNHKQQLAKWPRMAQSPPWY